MKHLCLLFFTAAAFAADPSLGKKLVFSDDFDGDKIDEAKWSVIGAREVFSFVKVGKGGALRIGLRIKDDMIQTHTLSSRGKFSQEFGYFEASMRMHAGDGHAGAFRISTDDDKTPPSITTSFHCIGKERVSPWARALLESGSQDFRPDKAIGKFTDISRSSTPTASFGPTRALLGISTERPSTSWTERSSSAPCRSR